MGSEVTASPLRDVQLRFVDSLDEALALKRWLGERREGPVGLDTESGGLSPWHSRLRMVQFGDRHAGWAVPWPLWGGLAQEVLRDWEGDWVCHNLPHDAKFLAVHAGWDPPFHRMRCTMVEAGLDDPLRPRGLKSLADTLVDPAATRGEKALHDGMARQRWTWDTVPYEFAPYWVYGALDPVLTCHLDAHLLPRVTAACPEALDLELGTLRVVTHMMLAGVLVDPPYVEEAREKLRAFASEAREWLRREHGVTSPLSAGQISRALQACGVTVEDFTPTGQARMDKEVLSRYRDWAGDQRARELAHYVLLVRHAEKVTGTYLDAFLEKMDGERRLHCTINSMGTRTHRMSSSDPNLQNLPRDDRVVRGSIIPAEGHVLVTCDLSQVEARMAAHFSQDEGLIEAFRAADAGGADFFCAIASRIFDEEVLKGDPRRQHTKNTVYGCVPLDYQILTRRGWLRYDQVQVGEETIGYDPALASSRWTRVTGLRYHEEAERVQLENAHQRFVTTPDHRWYGTQRSGGWSDSPWRSGFFTTMEINGDTRVLLGAPVLDERGPAINDDEAALLGWLFSDGHLGVNYEVGGHSQAGGAKRMVTGEIRQSTKKHALVIDELLSRLEAPHRRGVRNGDYVTWALRGPWLRELIQRAGTFYDEWPDPVAFAGTLSASQRAAMLQVMRLADGEVFHKSKPWQVDLVAALTYLSGEVPDVRWTQPDGRGWTKKPAARIFRRRPRFTGQRLERTALPSGPMWCVTTELGTWTTRVPTEKGYRVVLTGNSLYGAGAVKMALTAGVPFHVMKPVKDAFDESYPGIQLHIQEIMELARGYPTPRVYLPTGRYLVADEARVYTQLFNAKIQGHSAEYMKRCLLDIEAAGLGAYLRLVIHDEAILEVPRELAAEALRVVRECMTDLTTYRVAITAEGKIMETRWEK